MRSIAAAPTQFVHDWVTTKYERQREHTISKLARIARVDGIAIVRKCGLQLRNFLVSRAVSDFVTTEGDLLAVLLDCDRNDLIIEPATLLRELSSPVRFRAVLVLLPSTYVEIFGDIFCCAS